MYNHTLVGKKNVVTPDTSELVDVNFPINMHEERTVLGRKPLHGPPQKLRVFVSEYQICYFAHSLSQRHANGHRSPRQPPGDLPRPAAPQTGETGTRAEASAKRLFVCTDTNTWTLSYTSYA